jgi:hypothetical protein
MYAIRYFVGSHQHLEADASNHKSLKPQIKTSSEGPPLEIVLGACRKAIQKVPVRFAVFSEM